MNVFVTPEAQKQYKKISQHHQKKLLRKLSSLEKKLFQGKKLTGEFRGLCSLRVWPYRIVYMIDRRRNEVWVVSILHRQGAYK